MTTAEAYVRAVRRHLPPWLATRGEMLSDLRSHLADRLVAGEEEPAVIRSMDPPAKFAAALVGGTPLDVAPIGRRVAGFLIDVVIGLPLVAALFAGVLWALGVFVPGWPTDDLGAMWLTSIRGMLELSLWLLPVMLIGFVAVTATVLSFVYFPVAEAIFGTTIGKHLLGLCVVAEDGTRVTWGRVIIRRVPFYFEFFLLDAIFALFTRKHQRAFDYVAGTVVVRYPVGRSVRFPV